MLLVIFTETKRRGGCVSQEGTCAGWVVEWPLGSSPQRHWGATGALQPLTSVGTFCWAPGEGSPLPEWGMGERRATFENSAQGSAGRDRRPPLPSESGQCQSGDWRGDGPALRTPRTPEGGRFRSPGQRFGWSSWQSGCGRDVNTGGAARRAKAVLARQV